jgi:hypothetical protein
MLKKAVSKAAVSEEARLTLRYVELLIETSTPLADFSSILLSTHREHTNQAAHLLPPRQAGPAAQV